MAAVVANLLSQQTRRDADPNRQSSEYVFMLGPSSPMIPCFWCSARAIFYSMDFSSGRSLGIRRGRCASEGWPVRGEIVLD